MLHAYLLSSLPATLPKYNHSHTITRAYRGQKKNKTKQHNKPTKRELTKQMKPLPSIFSLRRPWDCFMMNFSDVDKTEKIQQMCEELKDGGTKAMKREWRRKAEMKSVSKKSNTCLWLTMAHTCMPTQTKARTNKTKTVIEALACAQTNKQKKTYWDTGRAKGWKIRWIYRAETFFCMLFWHFHSVGPDIVYSAILRLTKTHTVRLNSRESFWRKRERIGKKESKQAVEMSCGSRQIQ